jgi:hypothetical protein
MTRLHFPWESQVLLVRNETDDCPAGIFRNHNMMHEMLNEQ